MKTYLKVKIKTLATEAKIIRSEEKRWERRVYLGTKYNSKTDQEEPRYKVVRNHPLRLGLQQHRKTVVRKEARLSQLAYAYLRGRPLITVDECAARCTVQDNRSNIGFGVNWPFVALNSHWAFLTPEDWVKVKAMVERFGGDTKGFDDWALGRGE